MEATEPVENVAPNAQLFTKLAKIMGSLTRIPKAGYNQGQKYKFASNDDVVDAIREKLAEANIMFFPQILASDRTEILSTGEKATRGIHAHVAFEMTFACGDSGAMITRRWEAEAMDYGDKATNKAATAAEKYFLLKTFMLSTGDTVDPDVDSPQAKDKSSAKQQQSAPAPQPAPPNGKDLPVGPRIFRITTVKPFDQVDGKNRFKRLEIITSEGPTFTHVKGGAIFRAAAVPVDDRWITPGEVLTFDPPLVAHCIVNSGGFYEIESVEMQKEQEITF